jgi:hypothetical protein
MECSLSAHLTDAAVELRVSIVVVYRKLTRVLR